MASARKQYGLEASADEFAGLSVEDSIGLIRDKIEAFYREKAGEVEKDAHKNLFLQIAEEEKKHAFLLENVIDFVTKPDNWLENAEFHHLEEY